MLGDLAYFAVRQLRNDPEVVRALRQVDPTINLNTMLGVYRAARRAPEFAARAAADPRLRALGRIGLAERGAFRGAFPERGMRELVALNAAQGDPEAAYFLANEEDLGRVYGARAAVSGRGMGRRAADRLADISREQVREPAVQYAIQAAVVPEVISITNEALARVGRDVQEIGNLISEKVGNGFNSIQAMIGDRLDRDIPLTPGATREHLQ
jgi:hypothetical protein